MCNFCSNFLCVFEIVCLFWYLIVSFGNYLIDNGYECILITDLRGQKYTNQFKGKIKTISASHLTGGFFFKIIGLVKLFKGFCQSFLFLLKLRPQIALSFGSYASLPPSFCLLYTSPSPRDRG